MSNKITLTEDQVFFTSLVKTLNLSSAIENREFFLELIHQLNDEAIDSLRGLLYAEDFDRSILQDLSDDQ